MRPQSFEFRTVILTLAILGLPACAAGPVLAADADAKPVVGWIEDVFVHPGDILIRAKLDTGADVSSLHGLDIEEFDRKGERWVRFTLMDDGGKKVPMERKVVRDITITRHRGREEKRVVVHLGICLGTLYRTVEVNLVDRTGLKYPMLVGRSFMADALLIDPSRELTTRPHCEDAPAQ